MRQTVSKTNCLCRGRSTALPFKSTLLDLSSRLARTLPPVGRSLVAAVSGLEDSLRAFSQLSVCFSDSNCSHRSADASSRGRDHSELENLSLLLGLRCGTTVLCEFFPHSRYAQAVGAVTGPDEPHPSLSPQSSAVGSCFGEGDACRNSTHRSCSDSVKKLAAGFVA
jgi:hypothetical protein